MGSPRDAHSKPYAILRSSMQIKMDFWLARAWQGLPESGQAKWSKEPQAHGKPARRKVSKIRKSKKSMKLTEENQKIIDAKSYKQLLSHWRNAPVGNEWFEGETGDYWGKRMAALRNQPEGNATHVSASKSIGWDGV